MANRKATLREHFLASADSRGLKGVQEWYYVWKPDSGRPQQATRSSLTPLRQTLSRTTGSRVIREEKITVDSVSSRCKQIPFHWAEPLTYWLHHLRKESLFPGPQPLPWQGVCSLIPVPWDVCCSERPQSPLGPQEDLMRQSA